MQSGLERRRRAVAVFFPLLLACPRSALLAVQVTRTLEDHESHVRARPAASPPMPGARKCGRRQLDSTSLGAAPPPREHTCASCGAKQKGPRRTALQRCGKHSRVEE